MRQKFLEKQMKGQSLVEFALILPILLLIVIGIIEFGRIFLLYTEASNAAREAARYGVAAGQSPNGKPRYLDCVEIRQAAMDTTVLSNFDPVTDIEIAYDKGEATEFVGFCEDNLEEDQIVQGYRIVVTVTATFEPILPIIPIPDITFTPVSRRTILKDIVLDSSPEFPPHPPGCRWLQVALNPEGMGDIDDIVSVAPPPNCGGTWYTYSTTVNLTALPVSGYNFSHWGISPNAPGNGSTNPVLSLLIDNNYAVVANYAPIVCYQIDTAVLPIGTTGTAEVVTPQNCPNGTGWRELTGVQVFADEDVCIGCEFDHWEDSQVTYSGSMQNPLTIDWDQQTSDRTITAVFTDPVPDCYDIGVQINPPGEGTVTITPPRGAGCPNGWIAQDVVLSPEPDDQNAYEFDSWGGDAATACPLNDDPCTMTVNGYKTVVANFSQVTDVADVWVEKSDSVDPATVGQEFYYTLVVGNNGPNGAGNVTVTDLLPGSMSPVSADPSCTINGNSVECTIGFLPAFSNQRVDIAVIPNNAGTFLNRASVSNNDPNQIDTNGTNDEWLETTQVLPSADLAVTKSGPATSNVGNALTYNITVSNNGPSAATSVKLVDALPLTVSYLDHTISNGACSHTGTQLTCNLGNMPANGTPVTITIEVLATAESNAINQATVTTSTPDSDTANNTDTASTLIGPGNAPFITISPTCGSSGDSITVKGYNWPTAGNVDTTIHWDSITNPPIGTIPDSVVELGNGIWIKDVTIPPGATDGLHTIFAHHPQGQGTTASAFISVPCPAPDLTISSQVTLVSPTPINQGDPVSFRVTVTNTGVTQAVSQFPVSIYANPSPAPTAGSTHISSTFKIASAAVSGIPISSSQVITLTAYSGFPISGTNTVYAVVDSDPAPEGTIEETDETNNISDVLNVDVLPCVDNCGGNQTGNGILAGQAFVPSLSGELLPQPGVYVLLVGQTITYTDFTFTNNNGTYVFTDLPTGSYTVSGCINIDGTTYFFSIPVNIVSGLQHFQDLLLTEGVCV